jgi:hypothetical protein
MSAFDNCNNRSAHLNGLPVDQFLTTSCPGSCLYGGIEIQRDSTTEDYPNAPVQLVGYPGKPHYQTVSNPNYRIYNISDAIDLNPRRESLVYDIVANPVGSDRNRYNERSVSMVIDQRIGESDDDTTYPPIHQRDILIGFRSTLCTDACTLESDPIPGTCRIDCAGYAGCPNSTESGYEALEACQGLSSGFTTSASGNIYRCCTSDITAAGIAPLSAAFEVNATNVARSERLVMLGGKLVRLVVITFD